MVTIRDALVLLLLLLDNIDHDKFNKLSPFIPPVNRARDNAPDYITQNTLRVKNERE